MNRRLAVPAALLALVVAACGGTARAPSAAPPVSVAPSAVPGRPAEPSPSIGSIELLERLRGFASDPATTYRLDFGGQIDIGPLDGTIEGRLETAGVDQRATFGVTMAGQAVNLELVLLDRTAYVRLAGEEWQEARIGEYEDPNPLADVVIARDVRYRGVENRPAGRLHHLLFGDAATFDPRDVSTAVTDIDIRAQTLDLYLTDEGVPVEGLFRMDGAATITGGRKVQMFVEVTYEFSKVGEPIEIEAPI